MLLTLSARRRLAAATLVLAIIGCGEDPTYPAAPAPVRPALEIKDGARGGNAHFFFLPPIAARPKAFNGTFDPTLPAEVAICEWSGSACVGPDIARFTRGTGASDVRAVVTDEHYIVNWKTDGLDPARKYRIRILVEDTELGHADVAVGATGAALRNVDTDEFIPLVDGRTLPIKFRIEVGAVVPRAWSAISVSSSHSCALSATGRAYCWGDGMSGQLGTGQNNDARTTPTPVNTSLTFKQISAGTGFTCALTHAGAAYCWGDGTKGKLGNLTGDGSVLATPVAGGHVFASITAGDQHACGVTTSGIAMCWGYDAAGELGTVGQAAGTSDARYEPDRVKGDIVFAQLSAGPSSTCGVSTSGQAYCWGANEDDRLGTGVSGLLTEPTPVQQPAGLAFASVHLGRLATCGRATTGAAWCWGINEVGTAGVGEYFTTILTPQAVVAPEGHSSPISFSDLAVGWGHACGVAQNGEGWCWGFNPDGQAGPTLIANYGPNRPTAAGSPHVLSSVSVGERHSCAITTSGGAVCWGDNSFGQLGNGTVSPSVAPVLLPPPMD